MWTVLDGLKCIDSNCSFPQTMITEVKDGRLILDIDGQRIWFDDIPSNVSFLDGMTNKEKLIAIVQRFLDDFEVNGVTNLVNFSNEWNKKIAVYGTDGKNLLELQIINPIYEIIYQMILSKYLQDRYNLCWNEDIKNIRISLDSKVSRYDRKKITCEECNIYCANREDIECEKYIQFQLKTDNNGEILDFERKFIEDFLCYKFWQVGKMVDLTLDYKEFYDKKGTYYKVYVFSCGEFKITIPDDMKLFWVFDIVNNYNDEFLRNKEDVMKRQRKMEGF